VFTRCLALLALFVALSGCSSFETQWRQAATTTSVFPGSPIAGRWTGTWQNTNNTHSGALRALVRPAGPNTFKARFHATWGKHSGSFRTTLRGRFEGDEFVFTGTKRILFVKLTTAGRISTNRFDATYDSRFDRGTFTLKR
jgi:hypothetical protein